MPSPSEQERRDRLPHGPGGAADRALLVQVDRDSGALVLRCLLHEEGLEVPLAESAFSAAAVAFSARHRGCARPGRRDVGG